MQSQCRYSKVACLCLTSLILKLWHSEDVPAEFARTTFVMLHKKGSTDDPTKYRCLAIMLNHTYKVLYQCFLLAKIEHETRIYLSEWQTDFRATRGCRDNVLTLRSIYDWSLSDLHVTFIDYSAGFERHSGT